MFDASNNHFMVRGLLPSLAIETVLAMSVTLGATYVTTLEKMLSLTDWWSTTVVISLAALLVGPVAAQISWIRRPTAPGFREDALAVAAGRVIGVILGLGFGITIAGTIISAF